MKKIIRRKTWLLGGILLAVLLIGCGGKIEYPVTRIDDVVEDYHGTQIADPYRWLEDDNSEETKAWVEAQNAVTMPYLNGISAKKKIKKR